jgi:DNA helicase-2/ATP-dependent DNA helicase PcrA
MRWRKRCYRFDHSQRCSTVSEFSFDDRVFHQKFGYGNVVKIDGNKLTIAFEEVVDSFVERV